MGTKKNKPYNYASHLPIDARLIPDIFSFSHVRGLARLFLITEITISSLVVIGTLVLVVLRVLGNQ